MSLKTKAEAEAVLAQLPLLRAVTVSDATGLFGQDCRAFTFTLADGSTTTINVSRDPDAAEIDTLADNLPVAGANRAAIKAALRAARNAAAAAKLG